VTETGDAAHPARWTEFGRAGRQHIEDHFTLDQQLDKTLALYQSILEHTPNHPMPLTGGYAQYEPKH
jgi:hypothetical protein